MCLQAPSCLLVRGGGTCSLGLGTIADGLLPSGTPACVQGTLCSLSLHAGVGTRLMWVPFEVDLLAKGSVLPYSPGSSGALPIPSCVEEVRGQVSRWCLLLLSPFSSA